jgi:uroporphyrinogen decarboxylase
LPYDRKIMEALPSKWWMNVLHLHGELPMFKFIHEMKAQVVSWHDQKSEPTLAQGKTLVEGAVCGGLATEDHMNLGTPTAIREAARAAIHEVNGRRLILAAGCTVPVTTPLSNLRAVREGVEYTT